MVKVSSTLYRELNNLVSGSGALDIRDPDAVLKYAKIHGFKTVVRTIQGNPKRYLMCVNEGIEKSD